MSDNLQQAAGNLCNELRPNRSRKEYVDLITSIVQYLEIAGDACERNKYHLNEHARHPDEVMAAKISKLVEEDCHHNREKVYQLIFCLMVEMGPQLFNHDAGAGP